MGLEENKALVMRFYDEVVNRGNLEVAGELIDEGFLDHSGGRDAHGIDAFKKFVTGLAGAFPDLRIDVEDLLAEKDRVVARVRVSATHKGPFMDFPATGKSVVFTGVDVIRVRDEKFAERWNFRDIFGLVQQIKG